MTRPGLAAGLAALLTLALVAGACSGDSDGRIADDGSDGAATEEVLTVLTDVVIVPAYEALVANLDALDAAFEALCTAPSPAGVGAARDQWYDTELAWESTRAGGVGPAVERRLMGVVGFRARPDQVAELLAGSAPLDLAALEAAGSAVKGLGAIEVALFDPVLDTVLPTAGDRRCTYLRSAAQAARGASQEVLDDWSAGDQPYRDAFVAGVEGDPQMSVAELVNELTFRLQQIDDQGLRALEEAGSLDALPDARREGPAEFGVGSLKGVLGGVAALVHGPDEDGLEALVRDRSPATATRLHDATDRLVAALRGLPSSQAAAFSVPDDLTEAAEAAADLKVLLGTEVASQLGVTIGFSDADGDS